MGQGSLPLPDQVHLIDLPFALSFPWEGRVFGTDWGKESSEAEMLILLQWAEVLQMAASTRHANSWQQGACQVATAAYCSHHSPTPSTQTQKKYHLSMVRLSGTFQVPQSCRLAALCCTRNPHTNCLKMAASLWKPWAVEVHPRWQPPSSAPPWPGPWPGSRQG